jgi:hypothetical protein
MLSQMQRSPLLGGLTGYLTGSERQLLGAQDEPQQLSPLLVAATQEASPPPRAVRPGAAIMQYLSPEIRAQLSPARGVRGAPSSRVRRLSLGQGPAGVQGPDGSDGSTSPLAAIMRLSASFEPPRRHMIIVPREVAAWAQTLPQPSPTRPSPTRHISMIRQASKRHNLPPRQSSPSPPDEREEPSHPSPPTRSPTRQTSDRAPTSLVFFDDTPPPSKKITSLSALLPSRVSHDAPTSPFNADRPPSPQTLSLIRQTSKLHNLPPRQAAPSPPDEREDAHSSGGEALPSENWRTGGALQEEVSPGSFLLQS